MITATRRFQFCAGHRVYKHESKCAHMHGHNYVMFVTFVDTDTRSSDPVERAAAGDGLDGLGRVLDFSVMKARLTQWIEDNWDHGFIYYDQDEILSMLFEGMSDDSDFNEFGRNMKHYCAPFNPTAENMAKHILRIVGPQLFTELGVTVVKVELWETENCKVEVTL